MKISVLIIILVFSFSIFGQRNPAQTDVDNMCNVSAFVIDKDPKGLNVRSKPSVRSKKLGVIPFNKDGSVVHLTFNTRDSLTVDQINESIVEAADNQLAGVLAYTARELVSTDIIGNPHSSIVRLGATAVVGEQFRVASWYDNEWGFSNRMLDTAEAQFAALTNG